MKYRCDCGNDKCKITFSDFKSGRRCMKCAIERVSGKNASNYNFDLTDEEREKGRNYPEYEKWRKEVYKRDDYICCITGGRGGDLVAHHIESYGSNEELRLILSNGITMNKEHHIEFHKKYGYGNNTREQLNEFL